METGSEGESFWFVDLNLKREPWIYYLLQQFVSRKFYGAKFEIEI